jgi:hydroxyacylglutathione hydrolase
VVGVLDDVTAAIVEPSSRVTAAEALAARDGGAVLVDVRNPGEVADGAIPGSVNLPLPVLRERIDELDRTRTTIVYCAGGYRSSIARSVLAANGFDDVSDVLGGYAGLKSREQELMQ